MLHFARTQARDREVMAALTEPLEPPAEDFTRVRNPHMDVLALSSLSTRQVGCRLSSHPHQTTRDKGLRDCLPPLTF
jgi:hypothetical protein